MTRLAVDLRELRRPGTGIGRWVRNLLAVKKVLAPEVTVVGVGAFCDDAEITVPGPSLPWTGATLNEMLEREHVGLWLSPYYKIPPGLDVDAIATVHDTIPARKFPDRLVFEPLLRLSLATAWRIVTVSWASRQELMENWGVMEERIVLARNAVGEAFSAEPEPADAGVLRALGLESRNFFLAVLDDRPHKNLSVLVEALAGADIPPVVVAGTRRRDLPPPFHPIPTVGDKELSSLYRHAKALLHPAFEEGFGLPVLEALASGTPVIVSDISVMHEIAGDRAVYAPPADAPAWLAAAQGRLITEGLRERAASFRSVETYAWLWKVIQEKLD